MGKINPDPSKTKSLGTINEYLKSLDSSVRRKSILEMSGNRKKDAFERQFLTELVLIESEFVLKKKSKKYIVSRGKSDRRKFREGNCYLNSANMMSNGYDYVEGYVSRKSDGLIFGHAWNVNSNGDHIDFTLKDPENYDYFGVIIPEKVVWDVGVKNGHVWYSVLPFVDDEFNYKGD